MSFPEYLKERISEDYKNLIIQKLEQIKSQTEQLRGTIAPSLFRSTQALKDMIQQEVARILEVLDDEFSSSQAKLTDQLAADLEEYQSSWYHSDISAFQQQLEMLISDIISNVPIPPKKENADLDSLAELARKLDAGNTQSEILNIVLQHVSGWADRAVLFVVKGDQATGWSAFGLGDEWDANRVRAIRVNLGKDNVLRAVVSTGGPACGAADQYGDNHELFSILGPKSPRTALACPVMVRGKIAGVLYADLQEDLSEQPDVSNLLVLASRMAGSAIDLLPLKPKPAPGTAAAPSTAPTPAPAAPPRPAAPPAPVAQAPSSIPTPAARPAVPSMITTPAAAPAPAVAAAPPIAAAPAVAPAPPKIEEEEQQEEPEEEPSTMKMSKAALVEEVQQGTALMPAFKPAEEGGTTIMPAFKPAEIGPQDQKVHEDAKRFARLLVSEIKLYNDAQVKAGRENKDIYDRLKEDIERSRRMYMERVPQPIHSTTNYFYEELVRTLANGDPTLLGM